MSSHYDPTKHHVEQGEPVSPLTKEEIKADELFGRWIMRRFSDGSIFEGRIVSVDVTNEGERLYLVQYRDGDLEHLTLEDARRYLNEDYEYPEKKTRPMKKAPAVTSVKSAPPMKTASLVVGAGSASVSAAVSPRKEAAKGKQKAQPKQGASSSSSNNKTGGASTNKTGAASSSSLASKRNNKAGAATSSSSKESSSAAPGGSKKTNKPSTTSTTNTRSGARASNTGGASSKGPAAKAKAASVPKKAAAPKKGPASKKVEPTAKAKSKSIPVQKNTAMKKK